MALSPIPYNSYGAAGARNVDFNREVRPILSENCFKCHGPDDGARKGKLRFDLRDEALKPAKSGNVAIVPGAPEKSELIARITQTDEDERMPPLKTGKKLSAAQIQTLRQWIAEGAPYATHWSYTKPVRPTLPKVKNTRWPKNDLDRFILSHLESSGLQPSPGADRYTLIRRVSLDLTGLPPTLEEVDQFVNDRNAHAYEKLVDRLLSKPAFGEHWARLWLDLARYADSAGYADDPPRTIWAFRDYVIKAFNANKPFNRFTLEQIAGDLLDDASEEELTATAFHRNTMTNNEGGTSDEEFRNAAIVDRVNTTLAVWMATSMGCAQCHHHKYDPISNQDYFRVFAFFNNTADADLKDESPFLELYTPKQKKNRSEWQTEIAEIEKKFKATAPESLAQQAAWEINFPRERQWTSLKPTQLKARDGGTIEAGDDHAVKIAPLQKTELFTVQLTAPGKQIAGLRLESLGSAQKTESGKASEGAFAISHVTATIIAAVTNWPVARYVRVEIPGKEKILSLAEVQVFKGKENLALKGEPSQSSTDYEGPAKRAIDGKTDGDYDKAKSTTHTERSENPWWEVDLKSSQPIDRIMLWNRTDSELQSRLKDFRVVLLDEDRKPAWERFVKTAPNPNMLFALDGSVPVNFIAAFADTNAPGSDLKSVIEEQSKKKGWAIDPEDGKLHYLTLLPAQPLEVAPGSKLEVVIEQKAQHDRCPPALLRISASEDERISEYASVPDSVLEILTLAPEKRNDQQQATLSEYYRAHIAPELKPERDRLRELKKLVADLQPNTVPIFRELPADKRRKTQLQFRGNFLALGEELSEGVPAAFHPLCNDKTRNRLTLARWLVDENNPLTARVLANRLWEQIFGIGIVRTSEDFGSQGDLPSHPELLDWLACRLRDGEKALPSLSADESQSSSGPDHSSRIIQPWDLKAFLKFLVTSATYCQSSKVTPELLERDPDNRLLARGPRFRASAELVRDQALAVSGLLSQKMYGPPIRPPQPALGLTSAFGSSLDWKPSEGEDRYRRALYIEWRRTSPYASMATFDAPNREVCALRRPRSNTPLQALVTLNDPVYLEAAQALGNRMSKAAGSIRDRITYGFRLCLSRPPREAELNRLNTFYTTALADYQNKPDLAQKIAAHSGMANTDSKEKSDTTKPISTSPSELAAWTALGNVLLNLDEMLMKP